MKRFLPLCLLLACSGSSKDDSGPSEAVDPTDTADTQETQDTAEEADAEIPLRLTYTDGLTGVGIAGAEICAVIPETDAPCQTTDANGLVETVWEVSEFTNVLNRLTHENYTTTLFAGRYEQDVLDGWTQALETADAVEIGYFAFTPIALSGFLSTAGLVAEAGSGLALYWMVSADGSSLDGAVVTLENEAGESVGQVVYQNAEGTALDAELTATSASGVIAVVNAAPGSHTLRVSHDSLTCTPGFAFMSDVPNTTTVPVEADSQTLGNLFCFTE